MTYFVYLLLFESGYLYTGQTSKLARRLRAHHKLRGPGNFIWVETHPSRELALAREKQIKGWRRAKKLSLASSQFEKLIQFSKRRGGNALKNIWAEGLGRDTLLIQAQMPLARAGLQCDASGAQQAWTEVPPLDGRCK